MSGSVPCFSYGCQPVIKILLFFRYTSSRCDLKTRGSLQVIKESVPSWFVWLPARAFFISSHALRRLIYIINPFCSLSLRIFPALLGLNYAFCLPSFCPLLLFEPFSARAQESIWKSWLLCLIFGLLSVETHIECQSLPFVDIAATTISKINRRAK
jgi:hypothetical protein